MKHIDVRVALIFNPLPCNKVLSSVNTTYFLFLPSRMKANIDQTCRSIYVCVSSSESQRNCLGALHCAVGAAAPRQGAFSGRRGAFCLNVHQLP